MAQSSYPFDTQTITEDQWSAMMTTVAPSRTKTTTDLVPYGDSSGRQVKVPAGSAWVRGHYYTSTATETLAIAANATGNPRIDTVVLTLDPAANSIVLAVVQGTAAVSPVAPTLIQTTTGVYQLPLADVAVANGASTITAGNVTSRASSLIDFSAVNVAVADAAAASHAVNRSSADARYLPITATASGVYCGFYPTSSIGGCAAGSRYTFQIAYPDASWTSSNCLLVATFHSNSAPTPNSYGASAGAGQKVNITTHGGAAGGWAVTVYHPDAYTHTTNDGIRFIAIKTTDVT